MARIVFSTTGSYGDIHPYMGIGIELQRRGHAVTVATSAAYSGKIGSEGLGFHAVRPEVALDNRQRLAFFMDPRRGPQRVLQFLTEAIRESYEDTLAAAEQSDLMVTHVTSPAGVLVARKLGMPWVSTVLSPITFLSAHDPPAPAGAAWLIGLRRLGVAPMKALWSVGRRQTLRWIQPLIALQRELGIPDAGHPLFEGSHSPTRVLALFSKLLAAPQPDWPPRTIATGFPFFDRHHQQPQMSAELGRFLDAGAPPVVFTLGSSAVAAAGRFYRQSLEAVERMGVRAVFLTGPHPQDLPRELPPQVIAAEYAPHSAIFARASAIVHHGGVGTTAQGMRAGHPLLTVPFSHDQFDNALRVKRLGAGEVLYHSRYNARRAEAKLRQLLGAASYAQRAAEVGQAVSAEDGTGSAADAIEDVLRGAGLMPSKPASATAI